MTQQQVTVLEQQKLTSQEHLEAILFQFVKLYERYSEDRQVGVKQSSDTAKLVSHFTAQVNRFETLTPAVCDALSASIKKIIGNAAHEVSKEINSAAFRATENIAQKLKSAASDTEQTLLRANFEAKNHFLKTILISVGSAIASGMFIAWLLMPKISLQFSPLQTQVMHEGAMFIKVFPKLSKKEQVHIMQLGDKAGGF
ncbi:MAG: hypothetical protein Q8L78_09400 [Coxiellaceae bacterium]|nr:hypothetical protein [Coxiellaceae bacterium]